MRNIFSRAFYIGITRFLCLADFYETNWWCWIIFDWFQSNRQHVERGAWWLWKYQSGARIGPHQMGYAQIHSKWYWTTKWGHNSRLDGCSGRRYGLLPEFGVRNIRVQFQYEFLLMQFIPISGYHSVPKNYCFSRHSPQTLTMKMLMQWLRVSSSWILSCLLCTLSLFYPIMKQWRSLYLIIL